MLALLHVEIESGDSATDIDHRLPHYYFHLRHTHRLRVLPLVLFLRVGMEGVGVRETGEFDIFRFRCLFVGLPALGGVQYLESGSPLGVAMSALMRVLPTAARGSKPRRSAPPTSFAAICWPSAWMSTYR